MDYEKLCKDLSKIGSKYPNRYFGNEEQVYIAGCCLTAMIVIKQLQSENRSIRQNSVSMDVYKMIMDENTELLRQLSEKSKTLNNAVETIR